MDTMALALEQQDYVVALRRDLHTHPELSMQEERTIDVVRRELDDMGVGHELVPDGGLIGRIDGSGPGKRIILRADMDALPMSEEPKNLAGPKVAVSKVDGVAHTCGHDAHTAMLLGAARVLAKHRDTFAGTVLLAFERGEETGGGIGALTERLLQIGADGVWGIHVKPDIPSGTISVDPGPRMASALAFAIEITGVGGHGSRPDLAHSPIDCFVDLYQKLSTLRTNHLEPFGPITFSMGHVNAGHAANVIPETLTCSGTFRFLHMAQGRAAQAALERLIKDIPPLHGCTARFIKAPNAIDLLVNNPAPCSALATQWLTDAFGKDVLHHYPAWMASESFALLQRYFPGVFAFLGIGNEAEGFSADNHNPHFDIDESALPLGVASTLEYTLQYLKCNETIEFEPETQNPVEYIRALLG